MSQRLTLSEIKDHRQSLLDIDVLLIQTQKPEFFHEMEAVEAQIVVDALITQARARLDSVCDWMEWMEEAKEAEAAQ